MLTIVWLTIAYYSRPTICISGLGLTINSTPVYVPSTMDSYNNGRSYKGTIRANNAIDAMIIAEPALGKVPSASGLHTLDLWEQNGRSTVTTPYRLLGDLQEAANEDILFPDFTFVCSYRKELRTQVNLWECFLFTALAIQFTSAERNRLSQYHCWNEIAVKGRKLYFHVAYEFRLNYL